ncbi:putative tripeptidyl-peptidase II [Medicago truncatula]|uniref:Putative tripeptidyl-peptidase II n=1 Tax=Medicago truncatula TaxID=3880 RepID=G7KU92_MEDTR|nr:subtilisin-like protease Glyma18g48580 [Medicago truncatula]AES80542.1 subtilisin-like serine protease [Medicago truncatula]RHN47213.1 putative tripeptidyl-peptidase II [Medicago truncatula]
MSGSFFSLHTMVTLLFLFMFLLETVHGTKKCYIVYLGAHSHGPRPTSLELEIATNSHYDLLSSTLGSREKAKEAIIYSYNKHINGFAALLEDEEAADIAKKRNVVSVFLSKPHKLHTTRSWEFLGLRRNAKNTAWQKGKFGENTIIANIDTGVWPESKSFNDKGYGPVPSKWRGGKACEISKFSKYKKNPCNRKLIGARFFSNAYEAYNDKLPSWQRTARDFLGHGTHTLSTAGGNFVPDASVFAIGNGTVKGGSPRARVATYKVCWSLLDLEDCFGADVLAAIDQAISDGVDIISLSLAGHSLVYPEDIFTDEVSIGAFHALSRNILLVASAGNEGPTGGSVVNVAPWVFTIAASTLDRDFSSTITIGNQTIRGASLFVNLPPNQAFPLIVSTDGKLANATNHDAQFCKPGTLDPSKVKGKIVECIREGNIKSVAEGQEALSAGAKGMLLSNQPKQGKTTLAEPHTLSCVEVPHHAPKPPKPKKSAEQERAGSHAPAFDITSMDSKLKAGTTIKFSGAKTLYGRKPAPVMASFSSRGPNKIQPSILKPDVTAPGVNILAAYSLYASASNLKTDNRNNFPFNVLQGTSMSCPHVAGIAGLIKTLHPNWSPAAIKSAIMTTATTLDNTNRPIQDAFENKLAIPFDYGSGHVQPDLAIDPGLVYDLGIKDYLNFLCAYGYNQQLISALNFNGTFICSGSHSITDFNYPSITLPNLKLNAVNVTRTVTNVGPPGTYSAKAQLLGYKIVVLPNSLTFKKTGEKKTFQVIVQATNVTPRGKYQFGNLQWTDGKHIVRSPITVRRK